MKENQEGEAEKMSAQKRRNILVGFGAVAIVLALAVAYFAPSFNYSEEDASGAIGAVRKHRAPQITEADVVLGDEQTKQEQAVLYADFLSEAAALQNISAELEAMDQSMEARKKAAAQLGLRQADLNVRYRAAATDFLDALRKLGVEEQLGPAFFGLDSRIKAYRNAGDIAELNAAALGIVDRLGLRKGLASLQAAESQLNAFVLERRSGDFSPVLKAVESEEMGHRALYRAAYMDAIGSEALALEAASRAMLAARSFNAREHAQRIAAQAEQLEARAIANMRRNVELNAAVTDSLGRMSRLALNAADSLDARSAASYRAFSDQLEARSARYAKMRAFSRNAELAAINDYLGVRSLGKADRRHLASAMSDANMAAFAELAARSR